MSVMPRRASARTLQLLVIFCALILPLAGCGNRNAKTDADNEPRRISKPMASNDPIIVVATLGSQPNVVSFNLFNQTDRDCPVNDRFFALILPGERKPRVFANNYDWAQLGALKVPGGGQAIGRIEWRDVPPLAGARLVFNPEGTGFPPAFAVIEKVITIEAEDEPDAAQ